MTKEKNNRKITVSLYQERWKQDFIDLQNWYIDELVDLVIEIHHVGSTSVEGLAAKPIIDIDIEIEEVDLERVIQKLASLDYEYLGDLGIKDRYAFKYVGEKSLPKHNMYVCPSSSNELVRHKAFRDYLRTHAQDMERYGKIKLDAINEGISNIEEYMDYKGRFVAKLVEKAMKWANVAPEFDGDSNCDNCGKELNSQYKIRYTNDGGKEEFFDLHCRNCGKSKKVIRERSG